MTRFIRIATFHNKKHLQDVLNQKLNETVLSGINPHDLIYAEVKEQRNTVELFLEDFEEPLQRTFVQAAIYYLEDLGCEIGPPKTNSEGLVVIPLLAYPQLESDASNWEHLDNSMQQLLKSGEVLDVVDLGYEVQPGVWKLTQFIEGSDYYDSKNKHWIWSIGQDLNTGEIFASIDSDQYKMDDPNWKNLWLR